MSTRRGAERSGGTAQPAQHREQQRVLLQALAAAARVDQLVLHGGQLEVDLPAEQDIEVLERDRLDVRARDRVQRVQRGGARPVVADASEVAIEIEQLVRVWHLPCAVDAQNFSAARPVQRGCMRGARVVPRYPARPISLAAGTSTSRPVVTS